MQDREELREQLAGPVRTTQILVGALIAGVVIFTLLMVVLRLTDDAAVVADTPFVSFVGAGLAGMALIARPFLGLIGTVSDDADAGLADAPADGVDPAIGREAGNWTTATIVRNAILEGPALINVIAYFIEGYWWSLAIVAVLVAWMIGGFPTFEQLMQRIEERQGGITPEPDL